MCRLEAKPVSEVLPAPMEGTEDLSCSYACGSTDDLHGWNCHGKYAVGGWWYGWIVLGSGL
jgi:hypothetical protein